MAKIKGLWAPDAFWYKSMYGGPWCPLEEISEKVSFIHNGQNYTSFKFEQTYSERFGNDYQMWYTAIARLSYGDATIWEGSDWQEKIIYEPITATIDSQYLLLDFGEEQEVSDEFEEFLRRKLSMAPVEGINFSVPFEYLLKAGEASRKCGCGNIMLSSLDEKILEIYEKGKADALANQ